MTTESSPWDLEALCGQAGVSPRTVRYYIQRGLLPSPGVGRGPRYDQGYLDRLRLIRQLQARHLPLDEIKAHLDGLSDADLSRTVCETSRPESSAAEYIEAVLRSGAAALQSAPRPPQAGNDDAKAFSRAVRPAAVSWDRYELGDGIELHVRRPTSRERNRRIERIIAAAERILKE